MTEKWRQDFNDNSLLRHNVSIRISEQFIRGEIKGRAKYGPDFVGDPLQHAFEEACDLALYLAVEIERRNATDAAVGGRTVTKRR